MNEPISTLALEPSRPFLSAARDVTDRQHGINLEIEYLRAIAVLLVVFGHIDLFPKLGLGAWTGVDLFFCISGYVISRSFEGFFDRYTDEGRWAVAARAFWVRRIFRLGPSAWLWLTVNVICSCIFNLTGWFATPEQNLETAFFFLTFVTNFAVAHGSVHANAFLWSLTLEDQFYFAFPFFLLLFRGHWRWKIFLLLIFLQALPDRSLHAHPLPTYFWVTRLDALMWGCLVYQFSRSAMYWKLEPTFFRHRIVAFTINAALIYFLVQAPRGTFGYWFGYARIESQIAIASAALVFLASYDCGYVLPFPRQLKAVLGWIGARSYGIYLIHFTVFGVVQEIWVRWSPLLGENLPDPRYFYAPMVIVLIPVVAELNFRFVESPLRRKGAQIAKRIQGTGIGLSAISIDTAEPVSSAATK